MDSLPFYVLLKIAKINKNIFGTIALAIPSFGRHFHDQSMRNAMKVYFMKSHCFCSKCKLSQNKCCWCSDKRIEELLNPRIFVDSMGIVNPLDHGLQYNFDEYYCPICKVNQGFTQQHIIKKLEPVRRKHILSYKEWKRTYGGGQKDLKNT